MVTTGEAGGGELGDGDLSPFVMDSISTVQYRDSVLNLYIVLRMHCMLTN